MANLHGLPTPSMDWHANDLPLTLSNFKGLCELYFDGPLHDMEESQKLKYLLIWIGQEGRDIHKSWTLTNDDENLANYWSKFEEYVKPRSNFRVARYKLRSLTQKEGESIDAFMKRVKLLTAECKFNNPDDHMIDALIFGTQSRRVQSKLLEEDDKLTLDKAIQLARLHEATSRQLNDIQAKEQVHTLRPSQKGRKSTRPNPKPKQPDEPVPNCGNCGRPHTKREKCPAKGSKCRACGKYNHWKAECRSTLQNQGTRTGTHSKPVHTLHESDPEDPDVLYFNTLRIHDIQHKEGGNAIIKLRISSKHKSLDLPCKLDTGADGNVVPASTYKQLVNDADNAMSTLKPSRTRIEAYGGHTVKQYGTCNLDVASNERAQGCRFHVVDASGPIILGLPTCIALQLVTLNYNLRIDNPDTQATAPKSSTLRPDLKGNQAAKHEILRKYGDCFKGIGCFAGEYHITLDKSVTPVVHPPRLVAVALKERMKAELDTLTTDGILAKVNRPTDWVNSCVCTTKPNGKIRLCLDPKDLNKAVKRPHHYTPRLDDILPKLAGARFFSILDARSGYWNIRLDEESSYLTTFNTPFGRYRFLRLPFGLKDAQDAFQRQIDETFGDLPGTAGIADDLIIYGYDDDGSDHDAHLRAVLERAKQTGIKFNDEKMVIRARRIPFFGNIIGADGMQPDPAKVEAINALKSPSNVKELQTFLGMANYLSRFTKELATLSAPLRDLCKKDSDFQWWPEHEEAFCKIKDEISKTTNLQFFDEKQPVTLQVDASLRGLGAALIQPKGPVAFASKALTPTETRYSNIEREMLGIVYGLERFHHYVFGRHVTIETDHKPLVAITQKNLHNAPPRLARMLLRTQKYDFTLQYVPGRDIPLADALSRITPCAADTIKGLDITVHELHTQLNASPVRLEEIREATAQDTDLASLREMITHGWPETRSECPTHLHGYWNYRDELAVEDGIVLKGTRIVIPQVLRQAALTQLHYAHQGTEKCKLRARASVFWEGITKDIESTVANCSTCQRHQSANTREPLEPHDVPPHAWHTLATDLFHWEQKDYLLVCDLYSKFPIVRKLHSTTSRAVINQLKGIFDEHGIPEKLISDNGPQYAAAEFRSFAKQYGIQHSTTSPHYPQANGFIERNVQTIKKLFTKAKESGTDPHLAMICLRATPIDNTTPSPCEILNNRAYRSTLPSKTHRGQFINDNLQERQDKQKQRYDKSSRQLTELHPNDSVRVLDPLARTWEPAVVIGKTAPRSYNVQTSRGTYRRNRRHLRPTTENFTDGKLEPANDENTDIAYPDITDKPTSSSPVKPTTDSQEPYVTRSGRSVKTPRIMDL